MVRKGFINHILIVGLIALNIGFQEPCFGYDSDSSAVPITPISSNISRRRFSLEENPYKYSGYFYDIESGFYYLKARYYSPELMLFISRDTYDLSNRYAYCKGNPIEGIDPSGHAFTKWDAVYAGVGIAAAVVASFSSMAAMPYTFTFMNMASPLAKEIKEEISPPENGSERLANTLMILSGITGSFSAQATFFPLGRSARESLNCFKSNSKAAKTYAECKQFYKINHNNFTPCALGDKYDIPICHSFNIQNYESLLALSSYLSNILGAGAVMISHGNSLKYDFAASLAIGSLGGGAYTALTKMIPLNNPTTIQSIIVGAVRSGATQGIQSITMAGYAYVMEGINPNWTQVGYGAGLGVLLGGVSGFTNKGANGWGLKASIEPTERAWQFARCSYLATKGPIIQKIQEELYEK